VTPHQEHSLKALVQRVSRGGVTVAGEVVGRIGRGFVVLLGVREADTEEDARHLAHKTVNLRVFADAEGRMNLSVQDIGGEVLVVSQFTLYADTRKGNRPGFTGAAAPGIAEALYEAYVGAVRAALGEGRVATGRFGARMELEILNDGPVTVELCTDRPPG
jgi:D-tyrosyl-tRNA(Tyr) deacylase